MDTSIETIRIKPFSLDSLNRAVNTCLPFEDPGRAIYRHAIAQTSQQVAPIILTVGEAMCFFAVTVRGSSDEESKIDRFIGFLCGERIGHYEVIEDLYYQVNEVIVTAPCIDGASAGSHW